MSNLAKQFHDTYEKLAPLFGYETRADTKAFDPNSPNGKLMTAVCKEVAGKRSRCRSLLFSDLTDSLEAANTQLDEQDKRIKELDKIVIAYVAIGTCMAAQDGNWIMLHAGAPAYISSEFKRLEEML